VRSQTAEKALRLRAARTGCESPPTHVNTGPFFGTQAAGNTSELITCCQCSSGSNSAPRNSARDCRARERVHLTQTRMLDRMHDANEVVQGAGGVVCIDSGSTESCTAPFDREAWTAGLFWHLHQTGRCLVTEAGPYRPGAGAVLQQVAGKTRKHRCTKPARLHRPPGSGARADGRNRKEYTRKRKLVPGSSGAGAVLPFAGRTRKLHCTLRETG